MQPLAPLDAIGPALSRTRELLFHDFRLGRFLKVALVAALAEGMGLSGFNVSGPMRNPLGRSGHVPTMAHITPDQIHILVFAVVVMAVICIPITLVVIYLSTRFTFVNFDMVLLQRPFVRPGWEALRRPANRYFGLRMLVALAALLVVVFCVVMLVPGFRVAIHGGGWSQLLSRVVVIAPFLLLYGIAMMLSQCFLATFIVPRMALEDASISDSLAGGWDDVRSNLGSFLAYFLLRGVISLAIVLVSLMALVICVVIVALLLVGVVLILHHFFWSAGYGGKAIVVAVAALLGLALLASYVAAIITIAGFRNVFRQAYALLFYGGYYPALGNVIMPRTAPAAGFPSPPGFAAPTDLPPQATW